MTHPAEAVARLTNGIVDLEVSIDCGPRVLRYGYIGGRNICASVPHLSTDTPLGPWRPIGGHRLWVAPERMPGSYAPDDRPVQSTVGDAQHAEFEAPTDAAGMQKALAIAVDASGSRVVITHRITNRTCWPVRVAPWAITIVDPAGTAVMPQPPHQAHAENFLPKRSLVQWGYTDFTDPRLVIGRRLITMTPDAAKPDAQKIGALNEAGWCAVAYDECLFLKEAQLMSGEYPDLGCNVEFYTAGAYLEVETLAPLSILDPGESATHVEVWHLARWAKRPVDEVALDEAVCTALRR